MKIQDEKEDIEKLKKMYAQQIIKNYDINTYTIQLQDEELIVKLSTCFSFNFMITCSTESIQVVVF